MLDLVWDGQSTTSVQKVYSRYYHERIRIDCFRCDEIRFYGARQQVKWQFKSLAPQINPPFKYWFDTHPSFEITRSNEVLLMSSQPQVKFHQQMFGVKSLDAAFYGCSRIYHQGFLQQDSTQGDLCLTFWRTHWLACLLTMKRGILYLHSVQQTSNNYIDNMQYLPC